VHVIQANPAPAQAPRDSFGIFPGIPNPIRGAAGRLQGTLNTLSGCVGGAIAAAPYTPIVLIGGGMSVAVKGLSAMCEQLKETSSAEPEGDAQQPARGIATAPGKVSIFVLSFDTPPPLVACLLTFALSSVAD